MQQFNNITTLKKLIKMIMIILNRMKSMLFLSESKTD